MSRNTNGRPGEVAEEAKEVETGVIATLLLERSRSLDVLLRD